jgi:WD40 repeat protein
MNGNGGLGIITSNKNVPLYVPSSEKLCAVRHCNGVDIWVISHDWGNNTFRCWLVTQLGISVFSWSNAGTVVSGISQSSYGQLKASQDGKKLLACYYGFSGSGLNKVELYDFNNQNGFITNGMTVSTEIGAYGCEFSPSGNLIYASTNGGNLIQWDISSNNLSTIQSTRTLIFSGGPFMGSLQLGPDSKIYVARNTTSLSVINFPNIPGLGCGYSNLSIGLSGRNSRMGLPNFAPIYPPFSIGPIQHN